ncbi:hypothetical protein RLEG12_00640 (plasmid) [Rhizobium leguminosarum bv. trifolii CB782]|nr:hypothetical protein RLEG12_00640 [Rhizobium leguminosarum bv. trifolii CB782]
MQRRKKTHFLKRHNTWKGNKGEYAKWGPGLSNFSRKKQDWAPGMFGTFWKASK